MMNKINISLFLFILFFYNLINYSNSTFEINNFDSTSCQWLCGKAGSYLECPNTTNNFIYASGECGSGSNADCAKSSCSSSSSTYHALQCCQTTILNQFEDLDEAPKTSPDNWQCGGYGQYLQCPQNQAIVGSCQSGKDHDCKNGPCSSTNAWHSIRCSGGELFNSTDCFWQCGRYGDYLTCPQDFILTGTCASGKESDCTNGPCAVSDSWTAARCCRNLWSPVYPGLKVTFQQSLFDELTSKITPLIEKKLMETSFPPITGVTDIFLIGNVDWTISNLKFTNLNFDQNSLKIVAGDGLIFQVSNGGGKMVCDWKVKQENWPHASDSGSATITISKLSLTLKTGVHSENERIAIQILDLNLDLGHLDIDVDTFLGWVIDLFLEIFNGVIKSVVENVVVSILRIAFDEIDQVLQKIPNIIPLGPIEFDVSIPYGPVSSSKLYFMTPTIASFYPTSNPQPSPYQPVALPDNETSNMVNILVSEAMLNSFTYSLYKSGVLSLTLDPSNSSHLTNTDDWKLIVPELSESYPNTPIDFQVVVTQTPQITIATTGGSLELISDWNYYVISSNGNSRTLVLTLEATASGGLDFFIIQNATTGQNILVGNITSLSFNFAQKYSTIGRINLAFVNSAIKIAIGTILAIVNPFLTNHGIPLPSLNFLTFPQPNFIYKQHYFAIVGNVQINGRTLIQKLNLNE
eukprot:TRINITY_DN300_c4_g1_i2.p1 TRINITY_DN300_c4_g1~~TRINITY_DN300_c4_g1_i2.p1  ORF type:complete len:692 (-),score=289.78 TRINITY_DN300_c4_g1_i2:245-2320(-)